MSIFLMSLFLYLIIQKTMLIVCVIRVLRNNISCVITTYFKLGFMTAYVILIFDGHFISCFVSLGLRDFSQPSFVCTGDTSRFQPLVVFVREYFNWSFQNEVSTSKMVHSILALLSGPHYEGFNKFTNITCSSAIIE